MFRKKRNGTRDETSDGRMEPLILPNSRFKFSQEQLCNLNFLLGRKLETYRSKTDPYSVHAKSIAERLTQRLLCLAGMKDARFASKFLVDNNPDSINNTSTKKLSYLVRLDDLSAPPLYELDPSTNIEMIENDADCPPSYCRVRLPSSKMKAWNEFINTNGFLRRDKVQTQLVKLLAEAARNENPLPPRSIDESVLCSLPGKIVDAVTLHHILKIQSFEQLYYGQDEEAAQFPDPSEFRIAIVDEPQGILLRLEFLSGKFANTCLDVKLLVAIGIDAWPSSSDFPERVPLVHPDCLLYNMAAETGMFLVGFGIQSSAWQMRVPAAENTILNHYGDTSIVRTILDILKFSEEEIDLPRSMKQYQLSYKILNKYMFQTILFQELEKKSTNTMTDALNWSSMYLSKIVLTSLDQLIHNLKQQNLPNYFFRKSNLLVNPGHLSEDDYIIEANNVKMFILRLYDESLQNFTGKEEFKTMMMNQQTEMNLLMTWKELIVGMLPQLQRQKNGFCMIKPHRKKSAELQQYTRYQLEYISLVLRSILKVRKTVLKSEKTFVYDSREDEATARVEDLILLTAILMKQAKDIFLSIHEKLDKKHTKLSVEYSHHTFEFIETIKNDSTLDSSNLEDDSVLVDTVIKLLEKAVNFNPKILGCILRPFLKGLYEVTFTNSWHLEDIKSRLNGDELKSFGCFCKLVNSGEITPEEGLVDGVKKNWVWAKDIMELSENVSFRIVLMPDREQVNQYMIYPKQKTKNDSKVNLRKIPSRKDTFLGKSCFKTIDRSKGQPELDLNNIPEHELLKIRSPLTAIVDRVHRRGEHRGCGDTLTSLVHMKKMGVLKEISSSLSDEEKLNLSEMITEMQNSRSIKNQEKNWTNTLPRVHKNVSFTSKDRSQSYTPKEESAGVRETEELRKNQSECDTLLRNCRALRLRENDGCNASCSNLTVKGLVRKNESFKC